MAAAHPQPRADVSAKATHGAGALAMPKKRLPFAVPDWRGANAERAAYPMIEASTAIIVQPGARTPDRIVPSAGLGGLREELRDGARRSARPPSRLSRCRRNADAHASTAPSKGGR
jgi:hypothetical protein